MNRKGFTLIELLAVIVILAIIALIATPIILNIINSSKESATLRSAELYIGAVEQAVARENLKEEFNPESCTVQSGGNLFCDGKPVKVEVDNEKPTGGNLIFDKGNVIEANLTYDNKTVELKNGKLSIVSSNSNSSTSGSSTPTSNTLCTTTSSTPYAIGTEYTCELGDGIERTFYVLEDGDNTTLTKWTGNPVKITEEDNYGTAGSGEVALLMDRNISDEKPAWINETDYLAAGGSQEDWDTYENMNIYGPITALNYLHSQTSGWTKLQSSQIGLPTYVQLNNVKTANNNTMPTWTYDYLNGTTHSVNGLWGYWLSSTNDDDDLYSGAWHVTFSCYLDFTIVDIDAILASSGANNHGFFGVRPVITISKTQLG